MTRRVIAVVGGTGSQGGGVVDALLQRGRFDVRVLSRNPDSERAKQLVERGVEVVQADLDDRESVEAAFRGAHGAFVVTNFWEADTGAHEAEQGRAAVAAAKDAGVSHFIWSTLPNVAELSGGELAVHHFTSKARVDAAVTSAGFETHTFVEPPFYFQNLAGMMKPQPLGDGRNGWAVPMDPDAEVIHAGDVGDVGRVVARAFEEPADAAGLHLAVADRTFSWNQIASVLGQLGHDVSVVQVPPAVYDDFFPGAEELREMFQWWEHSSYFGPDAEQKMAHTRSLYPEPLVSFADWAAENMPVDAGSHSTRSKA